MKQVYDSIWFDLCINFFLNRYAIATSKYWRSVSFERRCAISSSCFGTFWCLIWYFSWCFGKQWNWTDSARTLYVEQSLRRHKTALKIYKINCIVWILASEIHFQKSMNCWNCWLNKSSGFFSPDSGLTAANELDSLSFFEISSSEIVSRGTKTNRVCKRDILDWQPHLLMLSVVSWLK